MWYSVLCNVDVYYLFNFFIGTLFIQILSESLLVKQRSKFKNILLHI